jgi:mitogen-activated protein kinase kinase kinase
MQYYAIINVFKMMNHPNVIRYYGCDVVESESYLYIEYCNQGSLHDVIYKDGEDLPDPVFGKKKKRKGGISDPKLVRHYIKQTIEALVYLHSMNIIHRGLAF